MTEQSLPYKDEAKPRKIIIAGGTGFIGQAICAHLKQYECIVLCRQKLNDKNNIRYVEWDGVTLGDWTTEIENSLAVINLAGRSVNCRHTTRNRKEILESRLNTTSVLGKAIQQATAPPAIWMNASSAALYPDDHNQAYDEYTTVYDNGFLADVSTKWESVFNSFHTDRTRKVILRITMVLGKNGGVIPVLKKLTKAGLAGTQGSGTQYMSWIHELDFVSIIQWIIDHPKAVGPYNCSAPTPVTNATFMSSLLKANHAPFGLPAPTPLLKLGAWFINTEPELVLKSSRVLPTKLLQSGFVFNYPDIENALSNL